MYGHKCKKTNTNSKTNKRVWLLSISQRKCVEGGRVHKLNALSLPSRHDLFVKRETMLLWTSCTLMQLLSRTPSAQNLSSCKQWAYLFAACSAEGKIKRPFTATLHEEFLFTHVYCYMNLHMLSKLNDKGYWDVNWLFSNHRLSGCTKKHRKIIPVGQNT